MPDIGLLELIIIGLIGFIVLGPERLPDFLADIAKVIRQGKMWLNHLKMQLDQEKQQLVQPIEQAKSEVEHSVQSAIDDVSKEKQDK